MGKTNILVAGCEVSHHEKIFSVVEEQSRAAYEALSNGAKKSYHVDIRGKIGQVDFPTYMETILELNCYASKCDPSILFSYRPEEIMRNFKNLEMSMTEVAAYGLTRGDNVKFFNNVCSNIRKTVRDNRFMGDGMIVTALYDELFVFSNEDTFKVKVEPLQNSGGSATFQHIEVMNIKDAYLSFQFGDLFSRRR